MIEQHPIVSDGTIPEFDQIVFGMITVFGRGNKIFFNFKNPRGKFKYKGATELALINFLKRIENMRISPMRGPAAQGEEGLTPLDLNVDRPSVIVLAFPTDSNMQFSTTVPAVTRKNDETQSSYSNLRYVRFRPGQPPILQTEVFDGCKVALFFAQSPTNSYRHGFNMHVDIVQQTPGGRRQLLPLLIDPDVRNPGGGGGS